MDPHQEYNTCCISQSLFFSVCIVYFQLWHPFEHVKFKAILAYGFYYKQFLFVYRYKDIWLLFSTFFSKLYNNNFDQKCFIFSSLLCNVMFLFLLHFCMILNLVLLEENRINFRRKKKLKLNSRILLMETFIRELKRNCVDFNPAWHFFFQNFLFLCLIEYIWNLRANELVIYAKWMSIKHKACKRLIIKTNVFSLDTPKMADVAS